MTSIYYDGFRRGKLRITCFIRYKLLRLQCFIFKKNNNKNNSITVYGYSRYLHKNNDNELCAALFCC